MKKNNYNNLFKIIFIIIFLSPIILNANQLSEVQKRGVLRWAADTESGAPYAFYDPNNLDSLIGFEVDIINEIAKELGVRAEHVQNQWDGLIPGLSRNDYDVAINGLEKTSDREEVVNFSDWYYITYEQLVVRKEQEGISNLSDLINKKVGTLKASLAERILNAAGGIIVKSYDSEKNSYTDLELRRLDAVLIDQPVALYYAGWNKKFKLTGSPIGHVTYGIALRKSDKLLLKQINDAIYKMKASGRLREIMEYWNLWNFMMANELNDLKVSNYPQTGYLNYINHLKKQFEKDTFWDTFKKYLGFLPKMLEAAWMTIEISIVSMIIAISLGLIIALNRIYGPKPIQNLAVIFIELIRGTPLLIQLLFIYYAFPKQLGIELSSFVAAVLGLGINYSAYEAENYRAGIFSVPKDQMEAAISLGMTKFQALRYIILPQAIRVVIPPITNDFISLLKDSSLVSVIAMVELTKLYQQLSATYYDYIGIGLMIAALYLLIGLPFVRLSKWTEKKFTPGPIAKKN